MKKNQTGFSPIEIILIIVVVGLLGAVGWFVYDKHKTPKTNTVNTKTPKVTPAPVVKDKTADWVSYSNNDGQYSLKYPKTWVKASNPELCGKTIFLLGANGSSVGKCGSGDTGQMSFDSAPNSEIAASDLEMKKSDFPDLVTEKVTINGIIGEKQTGTFSGQGILSTVIQKGQKLTIYILTANGRTYSATYRFNASYPDVSNDFNTVVTETIQFN